MEIVKVKNHLAESEANYFKELMSIPAGLGLLYIKFINEKGLMEEFNEWRKKKVFEVL